MGEAIHNEKWPVVEKQQLWVIALHYSPCPVVWPALCGLPALLLTPPTSTTVRSKEEEAGGDHGPQTRRQGFDLIAAA